MQSVSTEYREQFDRALRNPSQMRINFTIYDPDTEGNFSINADEVYYSDTSQLNDAVLAEIPYIYSTLERNHFLLNGNARILPELGNPTIYQGYVSDEVSNESNIFDNPPSMIIDFTGYFQFAGLTFSFDNVRFDYPTEVQIQAFEDGIEVYNDIFNPNDWEYVYEEQIPLCNQLKLTFLKTSKPERRVRMTYILLGLEKTLRTRNLESTKYKKVVDPLSTKLPLQNFDFTFYDLTGTYNPDNTTGLYRYLEEQQPVKFEYGYELDDGSIEWVLGGRNYSSGEVKVESQGKIPKVTFKTISTLGYLTEKYTEGTYSATGKTLLELANEVMTFAGLPQHPDGGDMFIFDSALSSYSTHMPLPEIPIRECLQLIANAGMCVLDVDRDGRITIKPLSDTIQPFTLDLSKSNDIPQVDKYPVLQNVETSFYDIGLETSSELLSQNVSVVDPTLFRFEYQASTNQSLTVGTGLTLHDTPKYYAYGCEATISGTGVVTINGQKLIINESNINVNFSNSGENCPIYNELISSRDYAIDYANWIGNIVALSNEYSVANRGYPELDVTDRVYLQTLYSEQLPVLILENTLNYDGTLKGVSKFLIGS